ncbi:hypothetical protein WA026_017655 [Henosepilachna vigintioctopunctata]|uniref:Uncharacterized protein n=1 Tax=Henosepilachna vigintioctopunctata TaxID=420089 RepID=A0AAW1U2X2_9CUCU
MPFFRYALNVASMAAKSECVYRAMEFRVRIDVEKPLEFRFLGPWRPDGIASALAPSRYPPGHPTPQACWLSVVCPTAVHISSNYVITGNLFQLFTPPFAVAERKMIGYGLLAT